MNICYKNYLFILLSSVGATFCMEQQIVKYEKRMPDHVRNMLDRSKKCKSRCRCCYDKQNLNQEEKWYALICATYYEDSSAVTNLLENNAFDDQVVEHTQRKKISEDKTLDEQTKNKLLGRPKYEINFPRIDVLPLTVARYTNNQEIINVLEQKNTLEDKAMVPLCALAAYMGDEDLLDQCIKNEDFDSLYKDHLGGSLLKLAVRNGHENMVKRLLELPEIKKYINDDHFLYGAPVLYIVAQRGFYDIAQQLLRAGANPEIPYWHPASKKTILPIHIAADEKHQNIVQLFCEKSEGYSDGRYWTYGQMALHKALLTGDERTIKVVLSVPAVNNYFYNEYLKMVQNVAVKYGSLCNGSLSPSRFDYKY
jgi:ankyrin repeat protein